MTIPDRSSPLLPDARAAPDAAAAADDDVEWEYEYDERETEHFYITLDLPSLGTRTPHKASHDRSGVGPPQDDGVDGDGDAPLRNTNLTLPSDPPSHSLAPTREDGIDGEDDAHDKAGLSQLQLLDLHTSNPLIKLDDALFSCTWSTDIGTQLYLSPPSATSAPARRGYMVDVVALSRSRLIGHPVTLRVKQKPPAHPLQGTTADTAIAVDEEDGGGSTDKAATAAANAGSADLEAPKIDPVLTQQTPASDHLPSLANSSFLARLADIKRRKGETDPVPLDGIQTFDTPTNLGDTSATSRAVGAQHTPKRRKLGSPPGTERI